MGMLAFSRESNLNDKCNINTFGKKGKQKQKQTNTLTYQFIVLKKKSKYINYNLSSANNFRF